MSTLLQCGDGNIHGTGPRAQIGVNLDHVAYWYWSDAKLCLAMSSGVFIVFEGPDADRISTWLQRNAERLDV